MASRRRFVTTAVAALPALTVAGCARAEIVRPSGVKKLRITGVRAVEVRGVPNGKGLVLPWDSKKVPQDTRDYRGFAWNWPNLGPMPGFQISRGYGKTREPSPLTPEKPLFPEPRQFLGPVKIGAPHFVDFGKNMEHSPDGKAYLLGMGAEENDPAPRPCIKPGPPGETFQAVEGCTDKFAHANLSWITADQVYLARVKPSPETINNIETWEFFAGHDVAGQPVWTNNFNDPLRASRMPATEQRIAVNVERAGGNRRQWWRE